MFWRVLLIIGLVVIGCFSFVLLFGAPYLPTLKKQIRTTFKLAELSKGDTIIELGCGDGRLLIAAAKKGINSVGYELNPLMFCLAWIRTRRYSEQVTLIYGDFWRKTWPPAEAIYVFLLPKLMPRLEEKIVKERVTGKIISFAFNFPGRQPVAVRDGVFLYDLNSAD